MKRNLTIGVVAAMALVLAMSSLGAAKVVVVNNWGANLDRYAAIAEQFTQETGIEVELLQTDGSQARKWEHVVTMIAGGTPPDLVAGISTEFVQFAAQDLIAPFDPYIERDGVDLSRLIGSMVSALQWRNEQYVMPWGASGQALAYAPSKFDAAGLPQPPSHWGDPSWSWQTFVESAKRITERAPEGIVRQWGHSNIGGWLDAGYNFGADWIDESLSRWTGSDEPMLNALRELQALRWVDQVVPGPSEAATLIDGNAAMQQIGTWNFNGLIDAGAEWQLAPFPYAGNASPVGVIYPVGLTLIKESKNKDEAWQFVKYVTTHTEGNAAFATTAGALPAVIENLLGWEANLKSRAPSVNFVIFGEQANDYAAVVRVRKLSTFGQIERQMDAAWTRMMDENASVDLTMEELRPVLQALVSEAVPEF